jgi:hypothetical protein
MRPSIRNLISGVALLGALEIVQAAAVVVDPSQPVAGVSQLTLSQQWWQWVLGIPQADNPLLDTTGMSARTNNNGPVFFVAGNTGGNSERTFSIQAGKPIFFPVLNNIDVEFPPDTTNCKSDPDPVACALAFISPDLNNATNLHATLDGQNLLIFPSFRQTSNSFFDLNLPSDNLFGAPAGFYPEVAVSDGYWVGLEGLSPGRHTLIFGGTNGNGFSLQVTDTINVPEPGTLSLVLLLGALAGLARRRCPAALSGTVIV